MKKGEEECVHLRCPFRRLYVFLVWTITHVYIDLHVHVFIHMGSVSMKYIHVCAVCTHVMVSEG